MKIKNIKGQTLIEMLIALSIVVISILGILVLVNRSLGLNKVASEYYTATYLASEGIELVKNLFDKSFLDAQKSNPGSKNFYGGLPLASGVYRIGYNDGGLTGLSGPGCSFSGSPDEEKVRAFFSSCKDSSFPLYFSENEGVFSYDKVRDYKVTKFKRLIILDKPNELPASDLVEYRVTSAVGWESRGGKYVVQLQDHFLPWRIP